MPSESFYFFSASPGSILLAASYLKAAIKAMKLLFDLLVKSFMREWVFLVFVGRFSVDAIQFTVLAFLPDPWLFNPLQQSDVMVDGIIRSVSDT